MAKKKNTTTQATAAMRRHDRKHLTNLRAYERQVEQLYERAIAEAAKLAVEITDFNPSKPFSFRDYPIQKRKADKLIKWLKQGLAATITRGVQTEWALANMKNDALANSLFGGVSKIPDIIRRKYYAPNGVAMRAFMERKVKGLALSDRVWDYSQRFKDEIELGLDLGIRAGRSAKDISRDIRAYLNAPDKLFRRVKTGMVDKDGRPLWRLSKAAREYHPGAGVYRSSYKNALRLTATETNMAYRTADHTRWQQMDFVLGQHVLRSNNHTLNGKEFHDICDELSGADENDERGRYPKDFKFVGWHPFCRCFVVPIMVDVEEMQKMNEAAMRGEAYTPKGEPVKELPREFREWTEGNKDRILKAEQRGTLPYFLRDNAHNIGVLKDTEAAKVAREAAGVSVSKTNPEAAEQNKPNKPNKPTALEIAKQRHAARTPEQVADIMRRAEERQTRLRKERIKQISDARHAARTQADIDRIKWAWNDRVFTPEQLLFFKELEKKIGVKRGFRMSIKDADSSNANPKRWLRKGYRINCQTCTPVYQLREWGFDVTAKCNTKGSRLDYLSHGDNAWDVWRNKDGSKCSPIRVTEWLESKGEKTMNKQRWVEFFDECTKQEGNYALSIGWEKGGHMTVLKRRSDGTLWYIEPQGNNYNANMINAQSVLEKLAGDGCPYQHSCRGIMRIDDKLFNMEHRQILEKGEKTREDMRRKGYNI